MTSVSAIVLAAGESTRMGQQKALLPWHGTTLIEYQLSQLARVDGVDEIIVVTGHEPELVTEIASRSGAVVAHNPDYRTGKVSSILAGLRATRPESDGVLLLAVDQPRSAATIASVVAAQATSASLITVPALEGHRGHPVLFSSELIPELLVIREETQGIRDVISRHAAEVKEIDVHDPDVLLDLNVPADLGR